MKTSMTKPLVCAIMPVNGRASMVRRAVASFRAQTYDRKRLLIYDTGRPSIDRLNFWRAQIVDNGWREVRALIGNDYQMTIGALRNVAIRDAIDCEKAEVFVHFDSDDWSHPQRIAEQVALLQASGADCVGYREALFWDTRGCNAHGLQVKGGRIVEGAAWLYSDPLPTHCLGASMMYWRRVWERRPFDHISHGEDFRFQSRCKVLGVTAMAEEPRMVCGIHGDRQSGVYDLRGSVWRRSAAHDEYCQKVMSL